MDLIDTNRNLYQDIVTIIENGRREIYMQANRGTILLFQQIGKRRKMLKMPREPLGLCEYFRLLQNQRIRKYWKSNSQQSVHGKVVNIAATRVSKTFSLLAFYRLINETKCLIWLKYKRIL